MGRRGPQPPRGSARAASAVGPARRGVRPPHARGGRQAGRRDEEAPQEHPPGDVQDSFGGRVMDAAVAVKGLKKTYGKVDAVKGVDFEVAPGEVFGFLGPNGAGK